MQSVPDDDAMSNLPKRRLLTEKEYLLIERQDDASWKLTTVHGFDAVIELASVGCTLHLRHARLSGGCSSFTSPHRRSRRVVE
jgi:hypothetical protein